MKSTHVHSIDLKSILKLPYNVRDGFGCNVFEPDEYVFTSISIKHFYSHSMVLLIDPYNGLSVECMIDTIWHRSDAVTLGKRLSQEYKLPLYIHK